MQHHYIKIAHSHGIIILAVICDELYYGKNKKKLKKLLCFLLKHCFLTVTCSYHLPLLNIDPHFSYIFLLDNIL